MSNKRLTTIEERKLLRQEARENPFLDTEDLMGWFYRKFGYTVGPMAITASLSAKFRHLDFSNIVVYPSKEGSPSQTYPEIEHALNMWRKKKKDSAQIPDEKFIKKAKEFWILIVQGDAMPDFDQTWLDGFKERYDIGEKAENVGSNSEKPKTIRNTDEIESVRELVKQFDPKDVYSMGERGVFWMHTPNPPRGSKFPRNNTAKHENRFMTMLCSNVDASDKLPLWLITHKTHLAWLEKQKTDFGSLGCTIKTDPKTLLTPQLMAEWLQAFDQHVASKKKNVLLVLDNSGVHMEAVSQLTNTAPLANTVVCFLPAEHATSASPFYQGMFDYYKDYYQNKWHSFSFHEMDVGRKALKTMTVAKAIRWSVEAWAKTPDDVITGSWHQANLVPAPPSTEPKKDNRRKFDWLKADNSEFKRQKGETSTFETFLVEQGLKAKA